MVPYQRLFWIQRITILALVVGIVMSWPLWFSDRHFPMIPVIPNTLPLNQLASQIALGLLGITLLGAFFWNKTRVLVLLVVSAALVIGLQDFNRLQPWYFQYLMIFIVLIPVARDYKKYVDAEHHLFAIQLVIAASYFFSALFKFNDGFYEKIIPYIVQPIANNLVTYRSWFHAAGYAIPPIEMLTAILLFIPRLRTIGVLLASGMHLMILFLLGPIGLNANSIVWPWNVGLLILVWVAFYKAKNHKLNLYIARSRWLTLVVLVFVLILPFLNLKGWYNESLSFELYSGRSFTPHLRYHHSLIKKTPEYLVPYTFKYGDTVFVNTYNWSMQSFNVPPNSDWKVIKQVQEKTLEQFQ